MKYSFKSAMYFKLRLSLAMIGSYIFLVLYINMIEKPGRKFEDVALCRRYSMILCDTVYLIKVYWH